MEEALRASGLPSRVAEDCLNGRRTVWDDPFKPGRKGLDGLMQKIEAQSPLDCVLIMLGTNDFQNTHRNTAFLSAQGIVSLIAAVRSAPLEPGMPQPAILVIAPPPVTEPKGPIALKFEGSRERGTGLAGAYEQVCREAGCLFFNAGAVTPASRVDGVHLDEDQHRVLGMALAEFLTEALFFA